MLCSPSGRNRGRCHGICDTLWSWSKLHPYSYPQEELHVYIFLQFYWVKGKNWKALPWAGHANTLVESQQSSSTKAISIEDRSNISKSLSCRRQHHDCSMFVLQSWCCLRQDGLLLILLWSSIEIVFVEEDCFSHTFLIRLSRYIIFSCTQAYILTQ